MERIRDNVRISIVPFKKSIKLRGKLKARRGRKLDKSTYGNFLLTYFYHYGRSELSWRKRKKNLGRKIIIERCDNMAVAIRLLQWYTAAQKPMEKNYLSSLAVETIERGILRRPIKRRKRDHRASHDPNNFRSNWGT